MKTLRTLVVAALALLSLAAQAQTAGNYKINPGDILEVYVWNEEDLTRQVRVRPDGFISLPLAGEVQAGGKTPAEVTTALGKALGKYLNDAPVITVSLVDLQGNIVYVLGKVNRPGAFTVSTPVDVTQALAWAGGLNSFADEGDIQILRRGSDGNQVSLEFDYGAVKNGEDLKSNILLRSGDVVVVP
ncbi:polysaccharide export protein [Mangrovimicrobium sediminis]|uniref:Polysaccharide export protein n=1 Tax=Mangrovimicrobium sediminis TaxID=2562682 RepID=A0A4Z0LX95_9GAMM|nr:polysaccharide biosynthesis/export family protein [Haliea sp. SAOS-164]TGD71870.1 polysaccharide export protein [Haliea sp. SAOS-164]